MINLNNSPDADDYDASSPDDSVSPDSLIDSKLKRKIDPRSIIKLLKIKNTVTDVDDVDDNASHDAMMTASHAPNAATFPYTENKTSVRQLLDGREYPVAKGDIIKKGFYCEAAVERCVA